MASIQGKKKRTRTTGVASLADASKSARSMGYCGGCLVDRQWRGWMGIIYMISGHTIEHRSYCDQVAVYSTSRFLTGRLQG